MVPPAFAGKPQYERVALALRQLEGVRAKIHAISAAVEQQAFFSLSLLISPRYSFDDDVTIAIRGDEDAQAYKDVTDALLVYLRKREEAAIQNLMKLGVTPP